MKLDRIDRHILEILQSNADLSNQELAERVGLSPTPCARRVKQLEQAGIISRKVTLLDRHKLGLNLVTYIQITMDKHTPACIGNFEAQIRKCAEVQECSVVAGNAADYLLKVIVPDMSAYHKFLFGRITTIEGVAGVKTSFVLNKVVDKTELPMEYVPETD